MTDLATLAAKAGREVFVTERDVKRVLAALLVTSNVWELIDLSDVPVIAICRIWEVLKEEGLAEVKDGELRLTGEGKSLCREEKVYPPREFRCPRCEGRGITLEGLAHTVERFKAIASNRPEAVQEYDQGYVTEETTLLRVAFMWHKGDLEGKEVLVLGDDDLVSVAAALTGAPARVAVLDIDDRLIEFIKGVSRKEGLTLEVLKHDLRKPLPASLRGAFDTFFTDPTESLRGFKAFVERAFSSLKGPGCAGYFGLTRREASLRKWREIQSFLIQSGAVITDLLDDFNAYVNWPYVEAMRAWSQLPVQQRPERIWYRSALYRVELVEMPEVKDIVYSDDIFFDEETATV